jgi:prepilin peptidase CpaA
VTATAIASMLACVLFVAAMLHVVVTDLRSRRIRNWLVAALAAAYLPLAIGAGLPSPVIAAGLGAALLVFAAGFGCFAAGWVGGGDAKLAPVCVLWLGPDQTLPFLALTSIFGGIMALALVATCALHRSRVAVAGAESPVMPRPALPYGPALAVAGLVLLVDSPWASAL